MRGGTESPSIWETERQPYGECLAGPRAPGGVRMSERLWSCQPSHPWGSKPPPALPPLHCQPVVATAAALPGCFIYLFCTNRVAADSFSPGLKEREEKKKKEKCFLALLSTSVLAAGGRSSSSSSGPAGGQAGSEALREVRAEGQLERDRPPALDRCSAQLDATLRLLR